jgi:hypothetical protein
VQFKKIVVQFPVAPPCCQQVLLHKKEYAYY